MESSSNLSHKLKRRKSNDPSESRRDGSISPPAKRRASPRNLRGQKQHPDHIDSFDTDKVKMSATSNKTIRQSQRTIPSPVQLNFVKELPSASNIDTISLGSVLGDPMIKECWLFNYLYDVDFLMQALPYLSAPNPNGQHLTI